ncbi:MAG: TonB-dependent receptor [Bacteroidales bacterium]|nr:TonB-dependent receptor [Bacteroidales bacterium]MBN2820398.1 TonB-dependent receptor [Bacteroidales bacterium]
MCKRQISNLFSLKKFCLLFMTIALVSLAGEVSVFAGSPKQDGKLIKGTVKEARTQTPLPGVAVVIKGTSEGTITDIDGNFALEAGPADVLMFRYIGYIEESVLVGEQTFIEVDLDEDLYGIDEIVVTGYGVQKKSDLTGSIASVSSEKLNSVPIPSVEHALQGMAAGVNIIPKSGKPGEGAVIQIRGISSINGSSPIVLIDGVSGDLNSLNPSDIASIEILKDASSAAIYGSTGGNGVILVTTKAGTSGKMKVSANVYHGIENPVNTVDMMNSQQYRELLEELASPRAAAITTNPDTLGNYDWQDIVFQPAITDNYDVSLSGGNEVSTYLFSTSLSQQGGIVKNTDYQRFTMRLNSEHKINKYIVFDEKITFVNQLTEGFDQWYWHNFYNNPIVGVISMDPTVPAYDENGDWTISPFNVGNPMVALDMKDKLQKNNNLEGNFGLKINLLKGLSYQSRITGKFGLYDAKEFQDTYWASPTLYNNQNELIMNMSKGMSYNFQNYVNYVVTLGQNHNISAMAGMEASKWWGYDISGTRVDLPSSDVNMLYFTKSTNGEADLQNVNGSGYLGANQAYFGRLNYDFMSRYLLTVNVRRDGAYNLAPAYRWGTFPSFSVGWKFTEEAFMQNIPFISTGKVRFGYGQTGANGPGGFPYLSQVITRAEFRYTVDGTTTQVGTAPNQIANPDLHWESVNMSNLGLDMTFLDNRLTLTADVFNKVSEGMILEKETSSIAGTFNGSDPQVNFGSVSNKGIEITAGARKYTGELTGSIDFNFSAVKNEVVSLAADSMQAGAVHTVSPTSITMMGQPIAQFYGLQIERMFTENDPTVTDADGNVFITSQTSYVDEEGNTVYAQPDARPGDAKFVDVNGDGIIDNADKVILGSPHPKFTYGFTLNLAYKGFDLSAFINGTYGNKIMNGTKQYLYNPVGYGNRGAAFADRYRDEVVKNGVVVVQENHNTDIYRVSADTYTKMSDFFVEDGSFVRLRNLTLGYTIPKSLTEKVGVERLRVYAGGKNLVTFTKYTGLNPEVGGLDGSETTQTLTMGVDIGLYPVSKMMYFGANLTF